MALLLLLFLLTVPVVSADEGKLLSLCFHGFIAFSCIDSLICLVYFGFILFIFIIRCSSVLLASLF
jgi:hypothetical protein